MPTTDHDHPSRGRRLDPAGLAIGVILPLALVAAAAAWLVTRWGELPAEFPSHWGPSGEVDAWAPPSESIGVPAAIVLATCLPMTVLAAFARLDRFLRRIMLAVGAPVLGMAGALLLAPVWRALAGESDLSTTGWGAAAGAAIGLAVGGVGAALLVDGLDRTPATGRPDGSLPRAPLVEERFGLALGPAWRFGIPAVLVVTVAVCVVMLPGLGVAVSLIVAPCLVMLWAYRVEAGPDGLRVRQAGMEILRVDAAEIVGAEVATVDPWAHGGVGYRLTGGGSVLLAMRKGQGVRITTGSGRTVHLGVPGDAAPVGTAADSSAADGAAAATRVAGILNAAADAVQHGGNTAAIASTP